MIKSIISIVIVVILSGTYYTAQGADLLEQAFQNSMSNQQVINIGNTKEAVGNEIFRGGTNINLANAFSNKEVATARTPWIVRFTQFLLSMTMVLSITFVIYQGIRYILSGASRDDEGDARAKLINIGWGIAIALSSVSLIFLAQSITISTITSNPQPMPNQGYPTATNTQTPVTPSLSGSNNTPPANTPPANTLPTTPLGSPTTRDNLGTSTRPNALQDALTE